jgi:hypothetical protein
MLLSTPLIQQGGRLPLLSFGRPGNGDPGKRQTRDEDESHAAANDQHNVFRIHGNHPDRHEGLIAEDNGGGPSYTPNPELHPLVS